MEEIKLKIKEIQDYFKERILKGGFDLINCTEYIATISIDRTYPFTFWVRNGETQFSQYLSSNYPNFLNLNFTLDEDFKLFKLIDPLLIKYNLEILNQAKIEQYNKLKQELGY